MTQTRRSQVLWPTGSVPAGLSQIVDTVAFITISFYGVRPIAAIMAGRITAKLVLSAALVPAVIWLIVRWMDAEIASNRAQGG